MVKWYNKPIEIITKRNVITVLLFINSLFFYAIQRTSNSEIAKSIGIFSFSMGIGQYIGERVGIKRKKNISTIPLLFIFFILIISLSFQDYIKNGKIISEILLGILVGEEMGFQIGRLRAKKKID